MANAQRAKTGAVVLGLFLLGLYLGLRIPRWFGHRGASRIYDTPVLLQQVQTLSDLVTVK